MAFIPVIRTPAEHFPNVKFPEDSQWYYIVNVGQTQNLDLWQAKTTEGNKIQIYTKNGTNAQKYLFTKQTIKNKGIQFTIQNAVAYGFFYPASDVAGAEITYTKTAHVIDLIPYKYNDEDTFKLKFVTVEADGDKELVVSLPIKASYTVQGTNGTQTQLAENSTTDVNQLWKFVKVQNS